MSRFTPTLLQILDFYGGWDFFRQGSNGRERDLILDAILPLPFNSRQFCLYSFDIPFGGEDSLK
jgi:hypothetical protein